MYIWVPDFLGGVGCVAIGVGVAGSLGPPWWVLVIIGGITSICISALIGDYIGKRYR